MFQFIYIILEKRNVNSSQMPYTKKMPQHIALPLALYARIKYALDSDVHFLQRLVLSQLQPKQEVSQWLHLINRYQGFEKKINSLFVFWTQHVVYSNFCLMLDYAVWSVIILVQISELSVSPVWLMQIRNICTTVR